MNIRTNLPFEHCDGCPEFVLSVNDKVLFYGGYEYDHSERLIDVSCKNANKCLRLNEMLKKEGEKHE